MLNKKGYQTAFCCAGHPGYKEISCDQFLYISFRQPYSLEKQLPDGAVFRKEGNVVCYDVPEEGKTWSVQELKAYQRKSIEKLLTWAEALPNI